MCSRPQHELRVGSKSARNLVDMLNVKNDSVGIGAVNALGERSQELWPAVLIQQEGAFVLGWLSRMPADCDS